MCVQMSGLLPPIITTKGFPPFLYKSAYSSFVRNGITFLSIIFLFADNIECDAKMAANAPPAAAVLS